LKAQEIILSVFLAALIALQFVRDDFALDQWTTILFLALIVIVFLDAHPEIIAIEAGLGGLKIKRAERNLEELQEQKPELKSRIEESVKVAKSESEDSVLAFLNLWNAIEAELKRLAKVRGLPERLPPNQLIRSLQEGHAFGTFESLIVPSLDDLRSIRNDVAHGEIKLKVKDASSLVELAAGLLAELKTMT